MNPRSRVSGISKTSSEEVLKRITKLKSISVDIGYTLPKEILEAATKIQRNHQQRTKQQPTAIQSYQHPNQLQTTIRRIRNHKEKMTFKVQKRLEQFKVANRKRSSTMGNSIHSELCLMQKSATASVDQNSKALKELFALKNSFQTTRIQSRLTPTQERCQDQQEIVQKLEGLKQNLKNLQRKFSASQQRENKILIQDLKSELYKRIDSRDTSNTSCSRCILF